MADEIVTTNNTKADVFSRGSLNLTYELLRRKDAGLALIVHNLSHGDPLPKDIAAPDNKNSDYFQVGLDSFQVRAIVENLIKDDNGDPGRAVMAKALVEDWMKLARKMIADLPDGPAPSVN